MSCGASAQGQVQSITVVDAELTGKPDGSFFEGGTAQYGAFALDSCELPASGSFDSGRFDGEILKSADMLLKLGVRITGPGVANVFTTGTNVVVGGRPIVSSYAAAAANNPTILNPLSFVYEGEPESGALPTEYAKTITGITAATNYADMTFYSKADIAARYCRWAPAHICNESNLRINTQPVDTVYADHIQIYNELYVPAHQQMRECMGNGSRAERSQWATRPQVWYVLLPFFFSSGWSEAYSFASASLSTMLLTVKTNAPSTVIENGSNCVITRTPDSAPAQTAVLRAITSSNWAPADLTAAVANSQYTLTFEALYAYLTEEERKERQNITKKIVMIQHQRLTGTQYSTSSKTIKTKLPFNFPVAHIAAIKKHSHRMAANQRGDYRGLPHLATVSVDAPDGNARNMISSAQLFFQNNARTRAHQAAFWTDYQQHLHAHNVLANQNHIALYSFGIKGIYGDGQVYGTANFSRIGNVEWSHTVSDDTFPATGTAVTVDEVVLATSLNVGQYKDNSFRVLWSS